MKYYVEVPEVWATEFLEDDPNCAGYWVSSLTQSWQKGYPDNCTVPWTNYVDVVRRLRLHSDKKIIVDVDMLYNEPSIAATVAKELYEAGCNTIVVESKRFPKVNSLTPDSMVLSTPEEFARLLNKVKVTVPELEVIARNEYLATTKDVNVTYNIAKRALAAGADGVVIHWGGDANTELLKQTLKKLKDENLKTGIIPTKYLDQVVNGDFDGLADFSILGNICSSFIRHSFSMHTVESLLNIPCEFKPILDRVNSLEPAGHKTLIVLGAKPNEEGDYPLSNDQIIKQFTDKLGEFYSIIFVTSQSSTHIVNENEKVHEATIEDSLGEAHTLSAAMPYLNTEYATVVYADLDKFGMHNLDKDGLLFHGDTFGGVLNVQSDVLMTMVESVNPTASILEMAAAGNVKSTIVN